MTVDGSDDGADGRSADRTILVVDDDPTIRRLVTDVLEVELGVRVVGVGDGYDAIQRLAASPPDLMLLDLRMPVVDGLAVLRWMRRHPPPHRVPVVAFTAAGLPALEQLIGSGCDDAVAKPFDLNDLIAVVNRNLSVPI
ncbi:MAG TPA: response regulator [Chloroflexota bacterium]|jgi:CheY-like chemotaxis protein